MQTPLALHIRNGAPAMPNDSILERVCVACGDPLSKRPNEYNYQFLRRKSCGKATCRAKAGWKHPDQVHRQKYGRMARRACLHCGEMFTPASGDAKFCSVKCGAIANQILSTVTLRCQECDAEFSRKKSRVTAQTKYCSQKCLSASRRFPERTITCVHCGTTFTTRKTHVRTFCSHRCQRLSRLKQAKVVHSEFEKRVVDYVSELGYEVIRQHKVGRYRIDAFLPELNVALECNGDYFHCNPRLYPDGPSDPIQVNNVKRDERRAPILESLGYRLIQIWESDVNELGIAGAVERVGLGRVKT